MRFSYNRTAFDIDIDSLEMKPWRDDPNCDISAYFNYGFTEVGWMQYVKKQLKIRADKGEGPPSLALAARLKAAQEAAAAAKAKLEGIGAGASTTETGNNSGDSSMASADTSVLAGPSAQAMQVAPDSAPVPPPRSDPSAPTPTVGEQEGVNPESSLQYRG